MEIKADSSGLLGGYLPGEWLTFWYGQNTGWTGYIRVDGITYIWMGDPVIDGYNNYYVAQQNYIYTSTKSIFVMDVAGQVGMMFGSYVIVGPHLKAGKLKVVAASGLRAGLTQRGLMPSPILGGEGNAEFLLWLERDADAPK